MDRPALRADRAITPLRDARSTTRPSTATQATTGGGREGDPCRRLEDAVAAATGPLEEARAALLAARCALVTRCAPLLSATCAGATGQNAALVTTANEGLAMLDRASAALGRAGDEVDAGTTTRLEDRIDRLRSFGEMFVALGGEASSTGAKKRLIRACNGLAVYLDDENAGVVESAKLWLGVAYRLAGRPQRSLQVLRPNLTAPADPRIGLAARLQRCLALGDRGDHVAAIALCLRLGARVEAWFADEDPAAREQAARTVRLTRVQLLRDWAAALRAAGQAAGARKAEADAKKLIGPKPAPPPAERRPGLVESIAGLGHGRETTPRPTTRNAERSADAND